MDYLLRALVLYDWPEDFDMPGHPEFVVDLVEDLDMTPTKASFSERIPKKELPKSRHRTIYKKSKLIDVISQFKVYESFELCEPIDGNFLNLTCDMQFSIANDQRSYVVAHRPTKMSLTDLVSHIRLFCSRMSPRYGFSRVAECPEVLFFTGGHLNPGGSKEEFFSASALNQSLVRTKQHVAGKILDVFELNVLSPPHLEALVQGRPLGAWIKSGLRGELIEINHNVSIWLVPESIRQPIRARLWREGLFIDNGMPDIWKLDLSHIQPSK